MSIKEIKVRVTLLEDMLGMAASDPEVHRKFIASKAPDAPSIDDEVASLGVDAVAKEQQTVFPRMEDGTPFMWDYQVKGFFKDACGALRRAKGTESSKVAAYRKIIDGLVFVKERKIPFTLSGEMGTCERPLRAQTAQGERVALASSETVPAGSSVEFTILYYPTAKENVEALLTEWLDYGMMRGFGQWRNSGKGRFSYEVID